MVSAVLSRDTVVRCCTQSSGRRNLCAPGSIASPDAQGWCGHLVGVRVVRDTDIDPGDHAPTTRAGETHR
jgi:hypothetical protein